MHNSSQYSIREGSKCHGNGATHCCHLAQYGTCPYVEENTVPGRRWACGLYRELGSWTAVHNDPRYLESVQPFFTEWGNGLSCGTWPQLDTKAIADGVGLCCYQETRVKIGDVDS